MKEEYVELPLIKHEAFEGGYRYILPIYSGNKELMMLIDSGADSNIINEIALKDCEFKKYRAKTRLDGISGEPIKVRCGELTFKLAVDDFISHHSFFKILPKEHTNLSKVSLDGILDSNFLSTCVIDFRAPSIRIYKL